MSPFQVIVLATPVFLLLIGLEFAVGLVRERRGTGRNNYRLNDAINSISLGVLSQVSGVFSMLLTIGIYSAVYASVALFPDPAFWHSIPGVLLALLFYDFCYYWLHRGGHRVAVLWAAHSVHHQSQQYNLSTALRQTSSGALLGWVFYLPMAVAGVPPLIFGIVALIDLLYQFWVHTEQIGKLGWFDRVFCSPSNHRVHHAVNDRYLDKNYGGILIVWDRLFGTFQPELDEEPASYGVIRQLGTFGVLHSVFHEWKAMLKDFALAPWCHKFAYLVREPGWSHDGSRDSSDTIRARWLARNGGSAADEPQRMADEGIAVSHP
jgi:sterol desaturase/sphingolipid hydroxylase (fatty acid hydroxylase superfamily)